MAGEYWLQDLQQIEHATLVNGGAPPPADAYTINSHPGPNYNCSINGIFEIKEDKYQVIVKILISFNGGSLILYTTYATLTLHTENMSGVQH
jgi:hypothetical protein